MKVQRTHEVLSQMDAESGRVAIFVEPTPELLATFTLATPDERDGVHCVNVTLESEEAVDQAIALTALAMEAQA